MQLSTIKEYYNEHNIEYVSCVPFSDVLPLLECRAKKRIPENAQTVIVCLFPYYIGKYEDRNISRYALGSDYHIVAGDILKNITAELSEKFSEYSFASFVDSSPIREVAAAAMAGLGSVGKNNQLINEKYGTYTFIGTIVTDALFENDEPIIRKNLCLGCDRCLKACPTGALQENSFDKDKCRSFITQKKGVLTEWEQLQIQKGGFVWGCDICNDVCPLNKNPVLTPIKEMYKNICKEINEDNLPFVTEKAFEYRGEKVIRRNIELLNNR